MGWSIWDKKEKISGWLKKNFDFVLWWKNYEWGRNEEEMGKKKEIESDFGSGSRSDIELDSNGIG